MISRFLIMFFGDVLHSVMSFALCISLLGGIIHLQQKPSCFD